MLNAVSDCKQKGVQDSVSACLMVCWSSCSCSENHPTGLRCSKADKIDQWLPCTCVTGWHSLRRTERCAKQRMQQRTEPDAIPGTAFAPMCSQLLL